MKFGNPNGIANKSTKTEDDDEYLGENFGALRFDKDLRGINSFLSNQTPYGVSVLRDSFARLQQISMLLSVETVSVKLLSYTITSCLCWLTWSSIIPVRRRTRKI